MAEVQFPVKVMEPVRVEALPVGDYLYQVKWDGMRWITYKSSRGMQFQTKAQKVFYDAFSRAGSQYELVTDGEYD